LSLDVSDVTIRGQGRRQDDSGFNQQVKDRRRRHSRNQQEERHDRGLAVEDAKGDAIKVNGCDGITFRKVRTS